jgi:hypothetical protein
MVLWQEPTAHDCTSHFIFPPGIKSDMARKKGRWLTVLGNPEAKLSIVVARFESSVHIGRTFCQMFEGVQTHSQPFAEPGQVEESLITNNRTIGQGEWQRVNFFFGCIVADSRHTPFKEKHSHFFSSLKIDVENE